MNHHTILIVEDNPTTRKMVRVALESEGYTVLEAEDGRTALDLMVKQAPDLILQDLVLPDIDGFELVKRLRALPGGPEIPILAFSGFIDKLERAHALELSFTDWLFKPVEPSRLLQAIQTHLPLIKKAHADLHTGRRILVADDDPIQLKLTKLHLEQEGHSVTIARDGLSALDQAQRFPPDVIVSDVLMPGLDGFKLCRAIRQDPRLAHIPVILVSSHFNDELDHQLGRSVGANDFIARTPDFDSMKKSLIDCVGQPPPTLPPQHIEFPMELYTCRIIQQLEGQVRNNTALSSRLSVLNAEFEILVALTQTLRTIPTIEALLQELLSRCLDAAVVSRGIVYLVEANGRFSLKARYGYPRSYEQALQMFFGHPELLQRALEEGKSIIVPSANAPKGLEKDILARSGAEGILITPLLSGGDRLGVLVLASAKKNFGEGWDSFAKAIGGQLGQAIKLIRTLSQLSSTEAKYRALVEQSLTGVGIVTGDKIPFANNALADMFGYTVDEIVGRLAPTDLVHPDDRPLVARNIRSTLEGEVEYLHYTFRGLRKDGTTIDCEVFGSRILYDGQAAVMDTLLDITERKQAEEAQARLVAILEATTDFVGITDAHEHALYLNAGGRKMLGVGEDEDLAGFSIPDSHPEWARKLALGEGIPAAIRDGVWSGETAFLHRSGREIPVSQVILAHKAPNGTVQFLSTLARDISERKRFEAQLEATVEDRTRELQAANRQLAEASHHKSAFLANMSHELRTPLNSILGFSELLQTQTFGALNEKQARYVDHVHSSGTHLLGLINDILDLSKVEAGKVELHPGVFHLGEALAAALSEIDRQADGKSLRCQLQVEEALSTMTADPTRFKQIFYNLLSNAVKFTLPGGAITVTAKQVRSAECGVRSETASTSHLAPRTSDTGDFIEIAVADTGIGMRAEDLLRLFQPFTQLDAPYAKQHQGTGLGLALTKRLVELHGGTIWAESEGEGKGSTFTVRLPLIPPTP